MANLSINEIFKDALTDPDLAAAINIDDLMAAIENDKNEHLDNKTLDHIAEDKYTQLKKLNLGKDGLKELFSKLSEYRYIDEIHQLHKGKHIRWIRIHNLSSNKDKDKVNKDKSKATPLIPKYNLTSGGIVVDIKFLETGTHIMVKTKNPKIPVIQYNFDDCITFQKLSSEEQLILAAYEYIQDT